MYLQDSALTHFERPSLLKNSCWRIGSNILRSVFSGAWLEPTKLFARQGTQQHRLEPRKMKRWHFCDDKWADSLRWPLRNRIHLAALKLTQDRNCNGPQWGLAKWPAIFYVFTRMVHTCKQERHFQISFDVMLDMQLYMGSFRTPICIMWY
jgi:hypothetical protein